MMYSTARERDGRERRMIQGQSMCTREIEGEREGTKGKGTEKGQEVGEREVKRKNTDILTELGHVKGQPR